MEFSLVSVVVLKPFYFFAASIDRDGFGEGEGLGKAEFLTLLEEENLIAQEGAPLRMIDGSRSVFPSCPQ